MNILITGAAGFLGQNLARGVRIDAGRVYCLTHDHPAVSGGISLQGDILDYPRMLEILVGCEIDQVYHCAAKSVVRNCRLDPLGCVQTNVLGTAVILEAARQSERIQGVMCMESDKSYGVGPVPYQEDQALRPHGIYEASKACVSHLVAAYFHNYHLPVFTIRSANVYGPGDQNKSRVVPNTIQRLLRGQPPEINEGADDFEREFIHVDDWVKIAVDLMRIGPWGEAVNVGSGECKTVAQVVYTICELMEVSYSPVIQNRPDTFCEIPRQSLCLEKLKSLLPEMTCRNLNQGLTETIQWYQNSI